MNTAGNFVYLESVSNSNLEELGPGKMGTLALTMETKGPGSSRRLTPPPLVLLLSGPLQGLVGDAEICLQGCKHLAAALISSCSLMLRVNRMGVPPNQAAQQAPLDHGMCHGSAKHHSGPLVLCFLSTPLVGQCP